MSLAYRWGIASGGDSAAQTADGFTQEIGMLEPGEVLHAGISVRGERNLRSDRTILDAAAQHLDTWQDNQSRNLPDGKSFRVYERITRYDGYATVTRYLTVEG